LNPRGCLQYHTLSWQNQPVRPKKNCANMPFDYCRPPCGKSHYSPSPNDTKHTGVHQSGKYPSTCTHRRLWETLGNQPRADIRIPTLALPELVLSTNLAQGAFGTESLAYLIACRRVTSGQGSSSVCTLLGTGHHSSHGFA
jgi:hypothetical protein